MIDEPERFRLHEKNAAPGAEQRDVGARRDEVEVEPPVPVEVPGEHLRDGHGGKRLPDLLEAPLAEVEGDHEVPVRSHGEAIGKRASSRRTGTGTGAALAPWSEEGGGDPSTGEAISAPGGIEGGGVRTSGSWSGPVRPPGSTSYHPRP